MVCIYLKQRLEQELKLFIGLEQTAAIVFVDTVFVKKPQYGQVCDKLETKQPGGKG